MDEATPRAPSLVWRVKTAPGSAALMFSVAGLLAILCTYTPIVHRGDLWYLRALGAGDIALAVFIYSLPWGRWPARALFVIPLVAFPTIGVFESGGALTPYTYPVFFIVVCVWIGLCLPPRSSIAFLPLAALTYLFPVWGDVDTVGARDSAFTVLSVCVLIAEVISRAVASVRSAQNGMVRLLEAAKALTGVSSTEEATDLLAGLASDLLNADAVAVFMNDPAKPQRFIAFASRNVPSEGHRMVIDTQTERSGMGSAIRRRETVFIGEDAVTHMNPRLQQLTGAEAGVFFTLAGEEGYVGAISVLWTKPRPELDSFARQAIELLSLMAGRVLESLRATARLSHEAERDPLTGLLNRRSFQRALEASHPGDALVLVDLDHFKTVNDRYGHADGDRTLVSLAQCIQAAARVSDGAARFGGEEFALLLSESGPGGAAAVVERLRESWERAGARTTFSAGIAVRTEDESVADALQRADVALYQAKHAGRNRTQISVGAA